MEMDIKGYYDLCEILKSMDAFPLLAFIKQKMMEVTRF
jgi:hypothetical protein